MRGDARERLAAQENPVDRQRSNVARQRMVNRQARGCGWRTLKMRPCPGCPVGANGSTRGSLYVVSRLKMLPTPLPASLYNQSGVHARIKEPSPQLPILHRGVQMSLGHSVCHWLHLALLGQRRRLECQRRSSAQSGASLGRAASNELVNGCSLAMCQTPC
jgi:hypothetical protein